MDTLVNKICSLALSAPGKKAVCFKNEILTYRQLASKSAEIARLLKEKGVKNGDRVCFSAVSKPEAVAVYLAVQMAGAVAVFLDKNGTAENMAAVYKTSESLLMLTDKPLKEFAAECNVFSLRKIYQEAADDVSDEEIESAKISPDEDDLAELLFTSGTTSAPKGVMLTYKAVYNIFQNTIDGIGIRADDILLLPLPLNHSFALRVLRAVLYSGATVVLQNGFTFARDVESNISAFGCDALACVPASYEIMKGQMQDAFSRVLGKLRFIEFGAGSLSVAQRREITNLLPNVTIYNTWGSSESGGAIFCNVSEVVKNENLVGALGKPLAGKVQVHILDSDGNPIQSDSEHPGRMALKGGMEMAGYWKNPKATEKTLKNGWLLTGDIAYLSDGYVFMLGRADDIINVGGEKVSPVEVENVAGQYPGIRECACIGDADPDGILGQIPVLFVAAKNSYSEDDLIKFLASRLERFKIPKKFVRVESLPRNRMQKIDRKELRRMLQSGTTSELMNPVVEAILERRSVRKFTDKEIEPEILNMILKCGYHAPSGHNMQSWRFTVLTKADDILRLKEAAKEAAKNSKVYFYGWENPKVMILVSNDVRNPDGCQDASCAAENIMLAAKSYGIGSVWLNPLMTLRNENLVKQVLDGFGVPENHTVWASVALGYALSDGQALKKNNAIVNFI